MEWVETTGRTVEEAKDRALDQLGVDEADAEFDVVEEPRPGLFGRVRGEARVRARVRPTRPRPKLDRRERRRKGKESDREPAATSENGSADGGDAEVEATVATPAASEATAEARTGRRSRRPTAVGATTAVDVADDATAAEAGDSEEARPDGPSEAPPSRRRASEAAAGPEGQGLGDGPANGEGGPDAVAPLAASFLTGLAEVFGVEATTITEIDGDELEVRLEGEDLGLMIGPRGQTLLAIQDIARTVSQRGVPDHGRLRIDIGGYRQRRRDALARFTADVARQVLESGTPRMLEPMAAADRKVVHDTASAISGVQTRSEGEEPNRRVVILPAD